LATVYKGYGKFLFDWPRDVVALTGEHGWRKNLRHNRENEDSETS
jgi:hypothetical protein